jgi:hypothetical protein
MALSLKKMQEQFEELQKQLNEMQDRNSELQARLDSRSEDVADANAEVEKLVRQNQEDPDNVSVADALKEIVGRLSDGEERVGLYWRSARGFKVTRAFHPDKYDIKAEAVALGAKNGWMLSPNWIASGPHFWKTRCVDTGAHAYCRWRYDSKHDVWTPEIGGCASRKRKSKVKPGEFPPVGMDSMLNGQSR